MEPHRAIHEHGAAGGPTAVPAMEKGLKRTKKADERRSLQELIAALRVGGSQSALWCGSQHALPSDREAIGEAGAGPAGAP